MVLIYSFFLLTWCDISTVDLMNDNSTTRLYLALNIFDRIYPSYFKLQVCRLRLLTRITDLSKLIGIRSPAAFLHFELFWVYKAIQMNYIRYFCTLQVCWRDCPALHRPL